MEYISTRHKSATDLSQLNFADMLLATLADDKGLYIPKHFPDISQHLDFLSTLSYQDLTCQILNYFIDDAKLRQQLLHILIKSYATFRHPEIVFLKQFDDFGILELFHGPTFAFKDLAMQVLSGLIEYYLVENNQQATILASTSGDTGGAAINAFKDKQNIKVIVLHPYNAVSLIQEKQMTTVSANNVANIAIQGNFDDAQKIVKSIFIRQAQLSKKLLAVNSINLVRILLQIPYYFFAYFKAKFKPDYFCVPSGNFGNALAAIIAKKMGLPIKQVIVATNHNDVLAKTITDFKYQPKKAVASISPSMDIQVSSNFERYLYLLSGSNPVVVRDFYQQVETKGAANLSADIAKNIANDLIATSVSEDETIKMMSDFYQTNKYILDPHTAVGLQAAKKLVKNNFITLSTAHPGKFFNTIQQKVLPDYVLPENFQTLIKQKSNFKVMPADYRLVMEFVDNF